MLKRASEADRYPSFREAIDYIETGNALNPLSPGSGKDPLNASVAVNLPLWQGGYRQATLAAKADSSANFASRQAAIFAGNAQLAQALASLHDADRRIALYRSTLIPQAEETFQSVLGGYQTGRAAFTASLWAQKELLDLRIELVRARATRATTWDRLERIVGQPLNRDFVASETAP